MISEYTAIIVNTFDSVMKYSILLIEYIFNIIIMNGGTSVEKQENLALDTQDNITAKETAGKLSLLMGAVLLSSSVLLGTEAFAKPGITEEQLEKARQTALQLKPPVDLMS